MKTEAPRPPLNAFMQSIALLVIRVGAGGLMLYSHGWPKVVNFADLVDRFANPLGLGSGLSLVLVIFAEVVCALLIVFGLFTRLAAIPLIIETLVLVFIHHVGDPWRQIELPLLFLTAYSALLIAGGGWYSLDNILRYRKRKAATAPAASTTYPGPTPSPFPTSSGTPDADLDRGAQTDDRL
jgi:putative oxidoreductase